MLNFEVERGGKTKVRGGTIGANSKNMWKNMPKIAKNAHLSAYFNEKSLKSSFKHYCVH